MLPWIWTLDDDASDLSVPGDNFDKRLLRFAENSGAASVSIAFNSVENDYYWTEPGQPMAAEWPFGVWTASVRITTGNTRVTLRVGIDRVDYNGAFLQTYADMDIEQVCTTGLHMFVGATIAQPAGASDRLRVHFQWTRNAVPGGSGVVAFGFGDPALDYIEVPILMANSVIIWNGNTLAFPGPLTGYGSAEKSHRSIDFSHGRVSATQLWSRFDEPRIVLASFSDAEFEAALRAWWSWAAQGKVYAFALDSTNQVDKTLSGAAAAGQKDIPIAATSGIVAGVKYRLRQAAGHDAEVVHIDSIVTNTKAVTRDNLKFTYAAADIFRARDYFPKVVSLDDEYPVTENPGITWTLDHTMSEDKG